MVDQKSDFFIGQNDIIESLVEYFKDGKISSLFKVCGKKYKKDSFSLNLSILINFRFIQEFKNEILVEKEFKTINSHKFKPLCIFGNEGSGSKKT